MNESDLQSQVADYLRLQYPNVMFHSDFGSGVRLTVGQALRQKRQNGGRRAWPDMFIACTLKVIIRFDFNRNIDVSERVPCGGLFLELKREGTRLKWRYAMWYKNYFPDGTHGMRFMGTVAILRGDKYEILRKGQEE